MNQWVQKSIELANGHSYLDKLGAIYIVGEPLLEGDFLSAEVIKKLNKIWKSKDREQFVRELINLKRFPYSEPYVGSLKTFDRAFDNNPGTIKRIIRRLEAMGVESIIDGLNRETMPSRQLGQSFRNWSRHTFKVLPPAQFLKAKGIAILDGGDESLAAYAKENFGYARGKGLDLVAMAYGTPVLGESKFISRSGGAQNGSFKEAIAFVQESTGTAKHVAIIDGLVWARKYQNPEQLKSSRPAVFSRTLILTNKEPALSALLLSKFLESFKK